MTPRAKVTAAQQTASSVGSRTAAQGNAILIDNPVQRDIQAKRTCHLVLQQMQKKLLSLQNRYKLLKQRLHTQATVQGQLEQLTANFDAANPPGWAAGALRNATLQKMAAAWSWCKQLGWSGYCTSSY